jgi:hypothetical protein
VARVGDCSWPPPGDCEGFLCLPRRSVKGTLVDCSYHLATSLVSRFLWCPRDEVHATLLAAKPPSIGQHNGD